MSRPLQILCTVLAAASLAAAADLGQLQQSFMKRYDEANATRDDSLKKLESSYLGALKRHMDKVKASGRLELVVPVRDEIEAVEGRVDPLPVLPENTSYDLEQLRKTYETARRQVVTDHAEAILGLAEKMTDALEKQEAELTKAGKIDEALAAKRMRETLGQDAGIQAARERLQAVKRAGKALPALRIRRCGDDLEVIVYYDRNGKVSMDSPVENVRESGEKQGDTNAKVLGEFVGAEGYEVDPYLALDADFSKGEVEEVRFNEMEVTPKYQVAGETGVAIGIRKGAKNPYGHLGRLLPTLSEPGRYRISCRYFIPDSNRVLTGVKFVQSSGAQVGGRSLETQGAWETEVVEGESSSDDSLLLLYLLAEKRKRHDASPKEFIVLASLKVEVVGFSAVVCKDVGDSGARGEVAGKGGQGDMLIRSGKFSEGR